MNSRSAVLLMLCLGAVCQFRAFAQSAETLFQKGIHYEEVKGELEQAIGLYKEVLQKYPNENAVAAKAQLHIGLCYEQLGEDNSQKAQEAFRAVIEKYSDQREMVRIARSKLQENQRSIATGFQSTTSGQVSQKRNSSIEEIKNTLAQFHSAYESKDVQKYYSFFSDDYLKTLNTSKQNNIEVWKNALSQKLHAWKTIAIKSAIVSIETSGVNYVVTENLKISGTDYYGNDRPIKPNGTKIYTFKKEENVWKILDYQDLSLPASYDSLQNTSNSLTRPGLVYVSHISRNIISVIDPYAQKLMGKIKSGYGSNYIELSQDGRKGYIANFNSNDVSIFDRQTGKTIATIGGGEHPTSIILTADGKYLLISHQSNDGIWILDVATNNIVKNIPKGTGIFLRIDKYQKIYQSQIFTPNVFVIDPLKLMITKTIPVGGRPLDISISPDQRFAYVANFDLNEIEKIDAEKDSVVGRIPNIEKARGLVISPDGKYAYATNVMSSTITIIDLANDSIMKKVTVGKMPTAVAFRLDGKYAYVSCQGNSSISVIDAGTMEVVQSIIVADNPINVQVK
jgi:YVTN family beta-propeller protein